MYTRINTVANSVMLVTLAKWSFKHNF